MSITETDLQNLMEVTFAQIDQNRNNKLEKNEVQAFEMQLHKRVKPGHEFDEDAFEDHFENLDKNDDGTVCKAELLEYFYNKAKNDGLVQ